MLASTGESSEEDEPMEVEPTLGKRDADGNQKSASNRPPRTTTLLLPSRMEEEEEDEPVTAVVAAAESQIAPDSDAFRQHYYESEEFSEAASAVAADLWDVSSWMILLTEFPRSADIYQRLGAYYIERDQLDEAYSVLAKGCRACWNIDLWANYLTLLRTKFIELQKVPQTEAIILQRQQAEIEFQTAVDTMGWSVDSYLLWKEYLNFLQLLPESTALEAQKKVFLLRRLYQRAVAMTFEQADLIFADYENFERAQQPHDLQGVETYLDEWKKKFLHAKSFLRDRRRLTERLQIDRPALPAAAGSPSEHLQLELWSAWLGYESETVDASAVDHQRPTLHMAFQQCLACFLRHPEVWLAFAQQELLFEEREKEKNPEKARSIVENSVSRALLQEGIRLNPTSAALKVALAEVLELQHDVDSALSVLKDCFTSRPDGFSFAVYQRFVRRSLGETAARRLFSETASLRSHMAAEQALQLYVAHALLELQVNCQAQVALNVLNLAREKLGVSVCLRCRPFQKLLQQVLVQMGDVAQLRWLFNTALEDVQSAGNLSSSGGSGNAVEGEQQQQQQQEAQLQRSVDLLEDFLRCETLLGSGDLSLLHQLRERRQAAKLLLEERAAALAGGGARGRGNAKRGLFDAAFELLERHEHSAFAGLGEADNELRDRIKGRSLLDTTSANHVLQDGKFTDRDAMRRRGGVGGGVGDREGRDRDSGGAVGSSSSATAPIAGSQTTQIPFILRDLASKLPAFVGTVNNNDIDVFVRHIRSVILPPRPAGPEPGQGDANNAAGSSRMLTEMEEEERDEDVSAMANRVEDDFEDGSEMQVSTAGEVSDVFRLRHRSA